MERLYLTAIHMGALAKLHEIAERHGAKISLYVCPDADHNDFPDNLSLEKEDREIVDWLCENGDAKEFSCKTFLINFELIEGQGKAHEVAYYVISNSFLWKQESEKEGEESERYFDFVYKHDLTEEWEEGSSGNAFISIEYKKTIYKGFNGKEYGEIYRTGIALKRFADAVCDYFGEPKIDVYYP